MRLAYQSANNSRIQQTCVEILKKPLPLTEEAIVELIFYSRYLALESQRDFDAFWRRLARYSLDQQIPCAKKLLTFQEYDQRFKFLLGEMLRKFSNLIRVFLINDAASPAESFAGISLEKIDLAFLRSRGLLQREGIFQRYIERFVVDTYPRSLTPLEVINRKMGYLAYLSRNWRRIWPGLIQDQVPSLAIQPDLGPDLGKPLEEYGIADLEMLNEKERRAFFEWVAPKYCASHLKGRTAWDDTMKNWITKWKPLQSVSTPKPRPATSSPPLLPVIKQIRSKASAILDQRISRGFAVLLPSERASQVLAVMKELQEMYVTDTDE